MSNNEFALPDVGEGLTEAEIVTWAVKPGDEVHLNQVICEIETAKSLVELPSPFEGVVAELLVDIGTTVPVGTPILRMQGDGQDADPASDGGAEAPAAQAAAPAAAPAATEASGDDDNSGAVLVGYGTGGAVKSRRGARQAAAPTAPAAAPAAAPGAALAQAAAAQTAAAAPATGSTPDVPAPGKVLAKPPVRKLAKDLGINLASVTPTGAHGQVLRDDVLGHASAAPAAAAGSGMAGVPTAPRPAAPQFTSNGEREERVPVKGIRKVVAQAMVESKFSAPHTGVYVDIDATRTMEFVKRLKTSGSFEGVRVSPLLIMAKAVTWALARNPEINSAWADTEIVRRNYVNLGIAAATPRGLVVPNIKDAHLLSLREMAQAIETLTDRARAGLTQPAEMQHGTITITNVGVFGVDFGLPILNPGETAIMAMGSIKEKPWVVDGEVRPRMVTTVGGSFDHRVVDGDVISNFVADVASVLEEPALLLD